MQCANVTRKSAVTSVPQQIAEESSVCSRNANTTSTYACNGFDAARLLASIDMIVAGPILCDAN
jgi:hypothetical protein